jgi:hypothetical protein
MKDAIGQVLATTRHPILVLLADTLNILQRLLVAFTTTFNHLHHIDDQYIVEQPTLQCALSHSLTHSLRDTHTSIHMAPTIVAVAELSMPPDSGKKKPPALERRK